MSIQQPEPDGRGTDDDEEVEDLPSFVAALTAETEADHENHVVARVALLKRLVVDPDVENLFAQWMSESRYGQAASWVARCWERLDRMATRMGFVSWADVEAHRDPDSMTICVEVESNEEGAAIQRELDEIIDECNLAAAELEAALAASQQEFDRFFDDAKAFVRASWARSWPWMVFELVLFWTDVTIVVVSRTQWTRNFWIASPEELPVPQFQTRAGETLEEAIARLTHETQAARAKLRKGRRTAPGRIDRYVEWWYRRYIRQESINRIAHDDAGGDRALVRYGIGRAQQWLDVANWVWRDEDAA